MTALEFDNPQLKEYVGSLGPDSFEVSLMNDLQDIHQISKMMTSQITNQETKLMDFAERIQALEEENEIIKAQLNMLLLENQALKSKSS